MAHLAHLDRSSLLQAMARIDAMGVEAARAAHGCREAASYTVEHDGRRYDPKLVVAVAAGLQGRDFSGGKARLGGLFRKAGLALQLAFSALLAAVTPAPAAAPEPVRAPIGVGAVAAPAVVFASGSNRVADIRGFAALGRAIGVAAPEVAAASEDALIGLAGSGLPVFVDSGAFGEVTFGPAGPAVKRPITAAEWTKRLDLYTRLGLAYSAAGAAHDLYLVAPDKVGFQAETLERLATYRSRVADLCNLGCNVMVVAQKGALSQADFDAECERVLGRSDYVRALPCCKAATSVAEARAFAAARQPAQLHLLGLSPKSRVAQAYLDAIRAVSPSTVVTMDSNAITSMVGRTNGAGGAPRALTAARDAVQSLLDAGKVALEGRTVGACLQELGLVLALGGGVQLAFASLLA